MDAAFAQSLIVVAILAAAVLYLGWRVRRVFAAARKTEDGGCGGGCGCGDGH